MTQKITAANIDDTALAKLGYNGNSPSYPPKLYSIFTTDSAFANNGLNRVPPSTTGYLKILGDNYSSPMLVYVGNTAATLVTVTSSQELRVTVPGIAGPLTYYTVYVVKPDGSYATKHQGYRVFVPI
jgi:hypothetical protein